MKRAKINVRFEFQISPEPTASGSEARREILEIAKNRPGTHVAKCIQAYDEQSDLAALILLLEELSKNTDYSTDLRISLGYVSVMLNTVRPRLVKNCTSDCVTGWKGQGRQVEKETLLKLLGFLHSFTLFVLTVFKGHKLMMLLNSSSVH